jgi:SPP1 gp7 family putative phage head morphogenesis protein
VAAPLTANEAYLDAALRHAVGIRKLTAGEVKRVLRVLEKADQELSGMLRKRLHQFKNRDVDFRGTRLRELLKEVRHARRAAMLQIRGMIRDTAVNAARMEERFERRMITAAMPVDVILATVDAQTLRALVVSSPFAAGPGQARLLQQWFQGLSAADQSRLIGAIQQGMAQGETIPQMMARISGTRARGFRDGVLAVTRRNATAIVRTAVNHVSNAAREAVWDANADIIDGLRWVSTLDGRTTDICIARDGKVAAVGGKPLPGDVEPLVPPGARPPAHVQCRSVMAAIFDVDGVASIIGERPYVRDLRTGKRRQVDFRTDARRRAGDRWRSMSRAERTAAVHAERTAWATAAVGQVPARVTYQEWLRRQPVGFQDDVLGVTKGKLFRSGGLSVDRFVDRLGGELTLEQLAKTNPEAFLAAGIDLEKFL